MKRIIKHIALAISITLVPGLSLLNTNAAEKPIVIAGNDGSHHQGNMHHSMHQGNYKHGKSFHHGNSMNYHHGKSYHHGSYQHHGKYCKWSVHYKYFCKHNYQCFWKHGHKYCYGGCFWKHGHKYCPGKHCGWYPVKHYKCWH